jgi:pimeloyl-ACP methyl ester carboxylesterase
MASTGSTQESQGAKEGDLQRRPSSQEFLELPDQEPSKTSQSWMEFVLGSETYEEAWKALCRPFRDTYTEEQLGPAKFSIKGQRCRRKDVQLENMNGQTLECSHFLPGTDPNLRWACVVYLHGNSSSRLEAHDVLKVCLPRNLAVFCFDFAGSGRSEGEYVSLGVQEQKDLTVVLRHLRKSGMATSIALWGRSMGAATGIFRASRDHCISAVVADSAFADLQVVATELVNSRLQLPGFIFDYALSTVRDEVQNRAGWDISKVRPIDDAPKARCPAYFGYATEDDFVQGHHAQELYTAWGGEERHIRSYTGTHNERRPAWWMHEVADWLVTKLDPKDNDFESVPLCPKEAEADDREAKAVQLRRELSIMSAQSEKSEMASETSRSQFYIGKKGAQRI